jgi:PAS domain S-box-containing protein
VTTADEVVSSDRLEGGLLQKRDRILEAIASAAERLLATTDWRAAVPEILARLGEATGASRTYLFANGRTGDGALTTTQLFEWCSPRITPQIDNRSMQNQPWVESGLGRWVDIMANGSALQGHIREFPQQERPQLEDQDIRSILLVPIFVGGSWWGHIGFDSCIEEREWTSVEIDALRVAGGILAVAIERRESERSLREQERLYRTLVEQLPATVYVHSIGEYVPIYTSPGLADLLGVPVQEYERDRLWFDLVHRDDRERVFAEDLRTDRSFEPFRMEYRMVARDGEVVWVRDYAEIVYDDQGEPAYWSGVMFDITELKRAQSDLHYALELERESATRLRALDEMKDAFLQAVSHDLRTPLSIVLGGALTLERQEVDLGSEEAKDLVHRVARSAQKLTRLVTDLLDLDRLTRGLLQPKRTLVDLADLAEAVVGETDALGRRVILDVPRVTAALDRAKVERIIENLVVNAARHTPDGSTIWVKAQVDEERVRIIVEDDGPGVPAEMRDQVFGAFVQGPTPSAHAPGSGIGLALVARFAELHGGRAWVEDRAGGGARFVVELGLLDSES